MPVRHGEGKLVTSQEVLQQIMKQNLAALFYATERNALAQGRFPYNPNGSMLDIAGLCSPNGRVFGLMPHPEGFYRQSQHPDFTLRREKLKRQGKLLTYDQPGEGLIIFKNAVQAAREAW